MFSINSLSVLPRFSQGGHDFIQNMRNINFTTASLFFYQYVFTCPSTLCALVSSIMQSDHKCTNLNLLSLEGLHFLLWNFFWIFVWRRKTTYFSLIKKMLMFIILAFISFFKESYTCNTYLYVKIKINTSKMDSDFFFPEDHLRWISKKHIYQSFIKIQLQAFWQHCKPVALSINILRLRLSLEMVIYILSLADLLK